MLCPSCLQSEPPVRPRKARTRRLLSPHPIDILTIGNDPALAACLSGLFRNSEWTVAETRTSEEGISLLKNIPVAVAVVEQRLPDALWREIATSLGGVPEAPALVVLTDDPSLVHEVVALGGFDVLLRPLDRADVRWTIACAWHAWMTRLERIGGMP
jgi:DNA-binding response OmpR family regulator